MFAQVYKLMEVTTDRKQINAEGLILARDDPKC